MYRRSQSRGISNTSERHGPLPSLYALLQMLQIPVSPFAPLGNAGNEAFYTLMAFQVMMMGNIRFPDILYRQQGNQYQSYPMPPMMPYVHPQPDSRRQSSSSLLRPESYAPPNPAVRRASDNARPRPSSLANTQGRRTVNGVPGMTRSQTVFWDDSDFAAENGNQGGNISARTSEQAGITSNRNSDDSVRGRLPPPSFKPYPSSRSISWEDSSNEQAPPPIRDQPSNSSSSPRRQAQTHSASASSLRLSNTPPQENSKELAEDARGKDKKKGKEAKGKLKSEKSVKDLAGALARFWVG
jgi:hypothetical protein